MCLGFGNQTGLCQRLLGVGASTAGSAAVIRPVQAAGRSVLAFWGGRAGISVFRPPNAGLCQQGISALISHFELYWVCHECRMQEMNITIW